MHHMLSAALAKYFIFSARLKLTMFSTIENKIETKEANDQPNMHITWFEGSKSRVQQVHTMSE